MQVRLLPGAQSIVCSVLTLLSSVLFFQNRSCLKGEGKNRVIARKEQVMEAKVGQTNRCFGNDSQNKQQQKQQKVKEVLFTAGEMRRAKNELNSLLLQFRGRKSILQLLPVIKRRCSLATLTMALERVEFRKHDLDMEDQVFFEEFKNSLK